MPDEKGMVPYDPEGPTALIAPWDPKSVAIWYTCGAEQAIALIETAMRLEDQGDKPFEICDVIAHKIKMVDKDGVVTWPYRTILVTPKGEGLAAVSAYVDESLARLSILRNGPPPWNPPVKVKLMIGRGKGGHHFYKLVPVK